MTILFDDSLRARVLAQCKAFDRLPDDHTPELKPAAVAIVLVEGETGPGFILTRRAATLRAHGGQWALPGGRCDAGETPSQAALREVSEEIGLSLDEGAVLGVLDDYPTRSGYLITPVVVWAGPGAVFVPNPKEVASIHVIALAEIAQPEAVDFVTIPESERPVVRIWIKGDHIHAPTAALLYQFREVMAGRVTRVAGDVFAGG